MQRLNPEGEGCGWPTPSRRVSFSGSAQVARTTSVPPTSVPAETPGAERLPQTKLAPSPVHSSIAAPDHHRRARRLSSP